MLHDSFHMVVSVVQFVLNRFERGERILELVCERGRFAVVARLRMLRSKSAWRTDVIRVGKMCLGEKRVASIASDADISKLSSAFIENC